MGHARGSVLLTILMFTAPACLAACSKAPTKAKLGEEGSWFETSYKTADGENHIRVRVDETVTADNGSDPIAVVVFWRAANPGKKPMPYTWKNKYLVDAKDRTFSPTEGKDSPLLQPTQESEQLSVSYEIPRTIDVATLGWGVFVDDKMQYRIALKPKPYSPCMRVGQRVDAEMRTFCEAGGMSEAFAQCFAEDPDIVDAVRRCSAEAKGRGEDLARFDEAWKQALDRAR